MRINYRKGKLRRISTKCEYPDRTAFLHSLTAASPRPPLYTKRSLVNLCLTGGLQTRWLRSPPQLKRFKLRQSARASSIGVEPSLSPRLWYCTSAWETASLVDSMKSGRASGDIRSFLLAHIAGPTEKASRRNMGMNR